MNDPVEIIWKQGVCPYWYPVGFAKWRGSRIPLIVQDEQQGILLVHELKTNRAFNAFHSFVRNLRDDITKGYKEKLGNIVMIFKMTLMDPDTLGTYLELRLAGTVAQALDTHVFNLKLDIGHVTSNLFAKTMPNQLAGVMADIDVAFEKFVYTQM